MTVSIRMKSLLAAVGLVLSSTTAGGATREVDPILDRLFGGGADARGSIPEPEWRPGHGTVVWVDTAAGARPKLVEFDPTTGDLSVLLDSASLTTTGADHGGGSPNLNEASWRPDGDALVIGCGDDPVLVDLAANRVTVLGAGAGPEEHLSFAPDGRRIAWVRGNDLWVYEVASRQQLRLTDDGSATVFNGTLDWVYREELADREGRAYVWSDDGSAIAWLRLDDGDLPVHHLVDLTGTHSRITEQRYPKAGDPSPRPSLHVVRFADPAPTLARTDLRFPEPTPYIPRFGFTPNGKLWYQILDRAQEDLRLVVADAGDGAGTTLVRETDHAWTEPVDGLRFLDDGALLWLSRRSGYTHLHLVHSDGSTTDLTPWPAEVTELVGTDRSGRHAWVEAARPKPLERQLFRLDLETGASVAVTTTPGTHSGSLEPDSARLILRSSSASAPPRWRVVDGSGGSATELPVEFPIAEVSYADHRFVQVQADAGVTLNAMLLLPPGFDEARRYPVVVYTYGGPHAQVVRDGWPGTSGLFNHALAARGFVVFALDNRGSAARSRAFEVAIDGRLGSTQLPDQLAGVAWLRARPWVDPERIGIWGWSYGGYMAAYALTRAPGTFAAAAAVAPVTDWRLYDSIYTERYMGTPEANPEGYAEGSVLAGVAELADPLLVLHGTADDNVHVQHSLQLADRAWRVGARFDLVLYPQLGHDINGPGSHLQLFSAIADFFEEHLLRGPDAKHR